MPNIANMVQQTRSAATRLQETCIGCNTCMRRCDLLEGSQWNIKMVCEQTHTALQGVDTLEGLRGAIDTHGQLYRFMRSCEACDRCTARCPQGLSMGELWRLWRGLIRTGGYIANSDVNPINVDKTWHTFSVFRTLNNIDYSDLPLLNKIGDESASHFQNETPVCPQSHPTCPPPHSNTLFFPGCTLVSYAPDLTRAAFTWLTENVGPSLLAEHCCAWPLECAGEVERTVAWREQIVSAARDQGVKRIVTVCPGCEKQLAAAARMVAPDIEFVSFAQLLVESGVQVSESMLNDVALPVSVVDSCNDRAGAHGPYVRQLFENVSTKPFPCTGQDAWCCGAGGNVAAFDEQLSRSRTRRSFSLCAQAGAQTLVAACPTCAYTYAFERWLSAREGHSGLGTPEGAPAAVPSINYLEIVFGIRIDWPAVFSALVDMWQGEHAAWVAEQLG